MAGRLFSESLRSRSRQSSRSSFRAKGNGKLVDLNLQSGEQNAVWFYNPDLPWDGQLSLRGQLQLGMENNTSEEVTATLQNGMLHITRLSASKNIRPQTVAIQDAIIMPSDKLGPLSGLIISFSSNDNSLTFFTGSEEDRDQWVTALRNNSLAHVRTRVDELTSMQSQTEADLREARRRSEEANKQVRDLKHEFAAQKASLEHDKARLVEAYEGMREKQEATELELRAARRELDVAKKEIDSMRNETAQQISETKRHLSEELRRTKSSYDAKVERLSREVSERENQLQNLQGDLQSAHSERHQSDQTCASMNRDVRNLKSRCAELQRQLDETITKLRLSNEKREELQNNVIAAQAANERAQQKLQSLTNEIKDHKQGRQVLEREVTGRRGQLSTLQQQSQELQRQIANLKGQLQVSQQKSEHAIKDLKETIKNKDNDLRKIYRANVELEAKYEVLRSELRDKNSKLRGIQRSGESRLGSRMGSFRPEALPQLASYPSGGTLPDPQRLELEQELVAARKRIQMLEENAALSHQDFDARLSAEMEESQKLRQRIKETEQYIGDQKVALEDVQKHNHQLTQQIGEQKVTLQDAQKQNHQLTQQIGEQKVALEDANKYTHQLTRQVSQADTYKEAAEQAQSQVQELQQQVKVYEQNSNALNGARQREIQLQQQLEVMQKQAADFDRQMGKLENELADARQHVNEVSKSKEEMAFKMDDLERELVEVQNRFYEAADDVQRLQDQLTLERKSIAVESQSLHRQRHNVTVALKNLLAAVQANSQDINAQLEIAPPHTTDPLPLVHLIEQVISEIITQRDNIQRELVALESQKLQEERKPVLQSKNNPPTNTLLDLASTLNNPGESKTAKSTSPRVSGLRRAASEVNQRTIEREISLKMYIDIPQPPVMPAQPQVIIEEEQSVRQVPSITDSKVDQKSNSKDDDDSPKKPNSEKRSNTTVPSLPTSETKKQDDDNSELHKTEYMEVQSPPTMRDLQNKLDQLANQQAALEDELYRNSSVQKDLQIKLKELRAVKTDSLSEEESKRLEKELTSIQEALEFTKDSVKQLESKIHNRQLSAQSLGSRLNIQKGVQVEEGNQGSEIDSRSISIELADAEAESQKLKEMEAAAAKTALELEELRKKLQEKDEILSDMHTRESELMSEVTHLNEQLSKKNDSAGKAVIDDADSTRDARFGQPNDDSNQQLLASQRRELGLRRQLHDMVLDLKGSIRVMTRLNPLLPGERQGLLRLSFPETNTDPNFPTTVLQVDSDHDAEQMSRKYEFDRVFQPKEGTERIYQEMEGVLASVLEGYKVCLVCYGHNSVSNAGGIMEDTTARGIMWRTMQAIFREGQSMPETDLKVSISMVEVGPGGSLADLLASNPHSPINNQIISHKKQSLVSQFTRAAVDNAEKAQQCLHAGLSQRNQTGGGSNLLYVVDVVTMNLQTNVKCLGKLYMADLLGTGGQDALGSLEAIVTSLVMRSQQFLAGRRTPLTKLLYEAMGGNARVLLMTSISPAAGREAATMGTLKFALRAMAAELGPAVPIKKLPGAPTPSSHRMSPVYPSSSSNEQFQGEL